MDKTQDEINLIKRKRRLDNIEKQLYSISQYKNKRDLNDVEDEEEMIKQMKNGKHKDKNFIKYDPDSKIEFTPFDLKEERDEGYFDNDNFYIQKKEQLDPWYESVKDEVKEKEKIKEIEHMKEKDNSDDNDEKEEKSSESENYSRYGEEDLYYKEEKITKEELNQIKDEVKINRIKLVLLLSNEKETVSQALQRLKGNKPQMRNQRKNNVQKEENSNMKEQFDKLLEIVSKLTELSYFEVYSDSVYKIIRDYGEKSILLFKYKTITADKKEEIFGTFTYTQMTEWISKKYFENTEQISFEFMVIDPREKSDEIWFNDKSPLYKEYFI